MTIEPYIFEKASAAVAKGKRGEKLSDAEMLDSVLLYRVGELARDLRQCGRDSEQYAAVLVGLCKGDEEVIRRWNDANRGE